jgi:hypothetical protein
LHFAFRSEAAAPSDDDVTITTEPKKKKNIKKLMRLMQELLGDDDDDEEPSRAAAPAEGGLRGGGKKSMLILGHRHQRFRSFKGNIHLQRNFDPQERQDAMRERLQAIFQSRRLAKDEGAGEKEEEDSSMNFQLFLFFAFAATLAFTFRFLRRLLIRVFGESVYCVFALGVARGRDGEGRLGRRAAEVAARGGLPRRAPPAGCGALVGARR